MTVDTFQNCVIFISDALRYDRMPADPDWNDKIIKTVASSINTPTSVPSMLTGRYPHATGVFSFTDTLGDFPSDLRTLDAHEFGFYNAAGKEDALNDVLGIGEMTTLDDMESPFVYVERDHGGHHPYEGAGYEFTIDEFKTEFAGEKEKTERYYREAVTESLRRFETRVETLRERGIAEETLFVFTSDHGEMLGEDGWVGHQAPVHPSLVYVPTAFPYSGIRANELPEYMGHVDFYPTIATLLGVEPAENDGRNVFNTENPGFYRNHAVEATKIAGYDLKVYECVSFWDADGGRTYNLSPLPSRLLRSAHFLLSDKWQSNHIRHSPTQLLSALKHLFGSRRVFGSPRFDADRVYDLLEAVRSGEARDTDSVELSDETKERLEQLGYR